MKTLTRALALLLLLTTAVMGQTYYVDASAAAGGDGLSEATAFDSIVDVNAVLDDGRQIIKLKAGSTFTLTTALRVTSNDTVMRYGFGANPILDGDGGASADCIDTGGHIKNLLIQDVDVTDSQFHGVQINGHAENVIIRRVHAYSCGQNGFAHDNATAQPQASGRAFYIDCKATANGVDGFNNRGIARDVYIRCISSGHSIGGGSNDGFTTHDSSGMELWYCTSTGDDDAVHFTHNDFGNAYCKIVGCTFEGWNDLALNLTSSEVGGGIYQTTFNYTSATATACVSISPNLQEQLFEGCQFYGSDGGAFGSFIDGAGTFPVTVRNSFFRMPGNTTGGSCYSVRQTSSGVIRVYNNTFVVQPDLTETSNYFCLYAAGGTTSQVVNNVFLKTDEPNAYFIRGATNWTQYDLIDGNINLAVTTNNASWYENAGGISFATLQADNKGSGGAATDLAGGQVTANPTKGTPGTAGLTMESYRLLPLSYANYGLQINCHTNGDVTSQFTTAFGNFGPAIRDGTSSGTWVAGPHVQTINANGSVSRVGTRVVFNHASIDSSWSSFKLLDGQHGIGDFTQQQGFEYLQLQSTAGTEVFIHAGQFGVGEEVLWTGQTGTVLPLLVNFKDAPVWAPPGKDIYISFSGAGTISGEVVAMKRSAKEPSAGGVPSIDLRPANKANAPNR
jgi:hypothetical protein